MRFIFFAASMPLSSFMPSLRFASFPSLLF
jgi:hypothetical protein